MTKTEERLAAARADLAVAQKGLAAIVAGEDAAAVTSAAYAAWRSAKADANVEVERLGKLISRLTSDVEAESQAKADAAQAAMETDANRTADKAAEAITEGLLLMHDVASKIMTAIAAADTKIELANRGRRPGLPPLATAEARARRGEKLERQTIADRSFVAWSYRDETRPQPISDELAARVSTGSDKIHGTIRTESGVSHVMRRRFRETRFLPEAAALFIEPLAEALAIPPVRGGGAPGWTPMKHAGPADLLRQVDELAAWSAEPDRRRPLTEVVCLGDVKDDVAA